MVAPRSGVELLNQFSPFHYFPCFSELPKHWPPVWYHIHIWQVSVQLSCRDTCQTWTRFTVFSMLLLNEFFFRNGKFNRALVTPTLHCKTSGLLWPTVNFIFTLESTGWFGTWDLSVIKSPGLSKLPPQSIPIGIQMLALWNAHLKADWDWDKLFLTP